MIDLLLFLFLFCLGYLFGWLRSSKFLLDQIVQNPTLIKELIERQTKDEISQSFREVEVQKERDIFYLYDKNNGEFLAQGNTLELALENISKRFPGQIFKGIIPKEQVEQMGINKQN